MLSPKVLKEHASRVDQMAETLGVDLEEAVLTGAARFDDVADAVLRCTACSDPAHCADWLQTARNETTAPAYCRNLELFAALRGGKK